MEFGVVRAEVIELSTQNGTKLKARNKKRHSREGGNPAGLSVFSGFLLA